MFQGCVSCCYIPKTKENWKLCNGFAGEMNLFILFPSAFAPSIRAAEEETDLTVAHLCKMLVLRAKHLYDKRKQRNISEVVSSSLFIQPSTCIWWLIRWYLMMLQKYQRTSKKQNEHGTWNDKHPKSCKNSSNSCSAGYGLQGCWETFWCHMKLPGLPKPGATVAFCHFVLRACRSLKP